MNEQLRARLDTAIKNIEARKQSEKILVLFLLVAGIVLGFLSVSYDPLAADIARLEAQESNLERQIEGQQSTYASMLVTSQEDPSRFANDRLRVITGELQALDREITNLAGDLVTPSEMTRILTSVLSRYSGLELIRFQNKQAMPLRTGLAGGIAVDDADVLNAGVAGNIDGQVFEHGLLLEFQGDFFTTLKYLRFLEEITGSFFWDSISFRQIDWPIAIVTLEIHTLSTDEGFIGV